MSYSESKRAEIMKVQAPMTVCDWLVEGIKTIDNICGKGYAKDHPELLGDFLKACGSDQEAMAILHLSEVIGESLCHLGDCFYRDEEGIIKVEVVG